MGARPILAAARGLATLVALTSASACTPRAVQPAAPVHPEAAGRSTPSVVTSAESASHPASAAREASEASAEVARPEVAPDSKAPGLEWNEQARARFVASPEDPPAVHRGGVTQELKDKQYLAGNEKTLHAFRSQIENIGGGYVGVGSDQAYLLIGWARPELAWLIDYDPDVVAIHEVYRIFLSHAETPQEMIDLWRRETRLQSVALLEAGAESERRQELRQLYLAHRGWIHRRLQALAKRLDRAKVPSWLTDQETYAFVRQMVEDGRVRPMVVNLMERQGMAGVAETARELGVVVRVLYLSNAEEYWPRYVPNFRENVAQLPADERSVVLRTLLIWDVNGDYRYNLQPLENFSRWLAEPWIRNVYDVVHDRPEPDRTIINYFETRGDPDASPRAAEAAGPEAAPVGTAARSHRKTR